MNQMSSEPNVAGYPTNRAPLRGTSVESSGLPWTKNGLELEYPARFDTLARLGHIPFLFWIVDALRPRTIVELGVGRGNSYFAFLQAARQLGLDVRCFGIDPWLGNQGEETHRELCGYHDPLYGAFSTLVRSSYDAATPYLLDKSIDLLHVAVTPSSNLTHDALERWLVRMSSRGVVVFHDINGSVGPTAAVRLWGNLRQRYPTFEFLHGNGLGVAYVGGDPLCEPLKLLFDGTSRANSNHIRAYFARLGISVHEHVVLRDLQVRLANADLRVRALENEVARGAEAMHCRSPDLRDAQTGQNFRQQMALIMRLQREVSTLNRKRIAWEQILQSTSWRITAPLRWVVIKVRWLVSKAVD